MPQAAPSAVVATSFKNLDELFKDKPHLKKQIEQSISAGELASVDVSLAPTPVSEVQTTSRPSFKANR